MNWLLDYRGDFVVVARDRLDGDVEINWSHPRLIIIAQNYAKWDAYAVNRMGEGIELWEYTRYGDDLLYLNQVYGQQRAVPAHPVDAVSSSEAISEPEFTLNYHTSGKPVPVEQMFKRLRTGILALAADEGEIIETPNKLYISYRHGKNFCEVQLMAKWLKLHLDIPTTELDDPHNIARDVSQVGHWGTGDTEVRLGSMDELDYVLGLVEQSYRLTL